jgi:hypothetical protein
MILYGCNKFLAVTTSFSNFGPMVRNFGIRDSWGPFQHPTRFIANGALSRAGCSVESGFWPVRIVAIHCHCQQNATTHLFCIEDIVEDTRFLWLYVWQYGLSTPPPTLLSLHLPYDLHIPRLCNTRSALVELVEKPLLLWLGSEVGSAALGNWRTAANAHRSTKLRSLVESFRNISREQIYDLVCKSLWEKTNGAKTALISGRLSVAEDLYETVFFQAADVVRGERYILLPVIAEGSQIEANQVIIIAGVAAYHLAILRAKQNITGSMIQDMPPCDAWIHARRMMEAFVPFGKPEEQQEWVEAILNELDNAETDRYIKTQSSQIASKDWVSKREQGRKEVFAEFIERYEAEIEDRWETWLRRDGEEHLGELVDF